MIAGFALPAWAQENHEKTLKLFQVMEIDKNISLMTDNMMQMMSKQMPEIKNDTLKHEFFAYLQTEIKSLTGNLTKEMVPIYEKNFTADEIQKYIDFYSTPEGKKLIESQPELQKQLMGNFMTTEIPAFQQRLMQKLKELHAKYK